MKWLIEEFIFFDRLEPSLPYTNCLLPKPLIKILHRKDIFYDECNKKGTSDNNTKFWLYNITVRDTFVSFINIIILWIPNKYSSTYYTVIKYTKHFPRIGYKFFITNPQRVIEIKAWKYQIPFNLLRSFFP